MASSTSLTHRGAKTTAETSAQPTTTKKGGWGTSATVAPTRTTTSSSTETSQQVTQETIVKIFRLAVAPTLQTLPVSRQKEIAKLNQKEILEWLLGHTGAYAGLQEKYERAEKAAHEKETQLTDSEEEFKRTLDETQRTLQEFQNTAKEQEAKIVELNEKISVLESQPTFSISTEGLESNSATEVTLQIQEHAASLASELAKCQEQIRILTSAIKKEQEAQKKSEAESNHFAMIIENVSRTTKPLLQSIAIEESSKSTLAENIAYFDLIISNITRLPPPLTDEAKTLVQEVKGLQTKTGTLTDDIEAQATVDKNSLTEYPEQLLNLIREIEGLQQKVEKTASELTDKILEEARDKVSDKDIEAIAQSLTLSQTFITEKVKETKEKHNEKIKTLGNLTTHWLQMLQKLNKATGRLNENSKEIENTGYKKHLIDIEKNLSALSKSITTIATTCEPVIEIREKLIGLVFESASSAVHLSAQMMRTSRKSYEDRWSNSQYPTDPRGQALFMEAFNAAYEQQKIQLGAICANGLLILPLLKTLISNLELRVGEGMTHENVPEEMKMRFAFIQGVPLDDIEYKVDLVKQETKRCQSLLASFKQQLNNYERACSSAKQEVGRTFDARNREGVYITETRYLNGVGPLAPYVDPDLRSPFDVVSETTTQAAASIQETAK